jgi:hypothetical protein
MKIKAKDRKDYIAREVTNAVRVCCDSFALRSVQLLKIESRDARKWRSLWGRAQGTD